MLAYEKLTVYERTIEFVAWSANLCDSNASICGEIQSQFKRAFISIALNIAEGAGKQTGKDQAKFYDIARGSALECGACLDVTVAMNLVSKEQIEHGKALLQEIVAMLTVLGRRVSPDRTRESSEEFIVTPETQT